MTWKLADAKNRFSEVVNLALTEGPQAVERRGDQVVVLSKEDYDRLRGAEPTFKELLMEGPSLDGVDLKRDRSAGRDFQW